MSLEEFRARFEYLIADEPPPLHFDGLGEVGLPLPEAAPKP